MKPTRRKFSTYLAPPARRRRPIRRRVLACSLVLVTSGVGVPYVWQALHDATAFFTALHDDVTSLKLDEARLQGQVTQVQKDLDLLLRHQLRDVAQAEPAIQPTKQGKDDTQ